MFADGIEDAGHPELARRSRVVARELLWAIDMLLAERSVRVQLQTDRDRAYQLLADHAGHAL